MVPRLAIVSVVLLAASLSAAARLPPPDSKVPPGTLARDRLGPIAVGILTGADRVEAEVRSPGRLRSGGFAPLRKEKVLDARFARRLTALLMVDRAYATDRWWSQPTDPVLLFRYWKGKESALVEIMPNSDEFRLEWTVPRPAGGSRVGQHGDLRSSPGGCARCCERLSPTACPRRRKRRSRWSEPLLAICCSIAEAASATTGCRQATRCSRGPCSGRSCPGSREPT